MDIQIGDVFLVTKDLLSPYKKGDLIIIKAIVPETTDRSSYKILRVHNNIEDDHLDWAFEGFFMQPDIQMYAWTRDYKRKSINRIDLLDLE